MVHREEKDAFTCSLKCLERFIDSMQEPVFVKDRSHAWILVNDAYCAMVGYTREQLTGKSDYDYYKKHEADVFWETDEMVLETGVENLNEEEFTDSKGRIHPIITKKKLYIDNAGEKYIVGVISDVSERKKAEEELRASESRYRLLAENASDVITHHDLEKGITYVSPSSRDVLGFTPEEITKGTVYDYIHPDDHVIIKSARIALMRTAETLISTYRVRHKNGDYRWVEASARSIRDSKTGEVKEIISVIRDISKRKKAEEEIKKALARERELSELKSRFVAMATHEFGTPLYTIQVTTDLLKEHGLRLDQDKRQHYFGQIQLSVQYMRELIQDVLDFDSIDAEKVDFSPAMLDIVALCRNLTDEMKASTPQSPQIRFLCTEESRHAEMDEKLLRQILINLLSNAVKYSAGGGLVEFELSFRNSHAVFRVSDEGIGIPGEDQSLIFMPFHRALNAKKIKGTGLGLAIAKKSVVLHGGDINFESEQGRGTTFTVTLPLFRTE
jgi:PAS domain S-box-containing protein